MSRWVRSLQESGRRANGESGHGRNGKKRRRMTRRLTAYELSESQVATPESVVSLFWRLAKGHRARLGTVLDMGAGDCRFAAGGFFDEYVGVEIDRSRVVRAKPPANGKVLLGCVFRHAVGDYDACIGNPPYAR